MQDNNGITQDGNKNKWFSFLGEECEPCIDNEIRLMDDLREPICDRAHTACFSGHRPERLPKDEEFVNIIKSYIAYEISEAVAAGFYTFIMGGSRGIDLWAGLAVMHEKSKNPEIRLIAALPYFSGDSRFSERDRFDYGYVLEHCNERYYASREYNSGCMKRRNLFMVENASRLIAFVGDYRSGTGQTIRMAKQAGVDIHLHDIHRITETKIIKKRPGSV
jgi:uncharacterized phage-like protein YoqJ